MSVKEVTQTPLKPLEIRRDPCPQLRKVSTVFFISLGTAAIGAALAFTLSEATIVVIVGGAVGFIVGLVIARHLLKKELPPKQQYFFNTFAQLDRTATHLKDQIQIVRKVFLQKEGSARCDVNLVYEAINTISKSIFREDLRNIWVTFLRNADGFVTSGGLTFNFQYEINRNSLYGKVLQEGSQSLEERDRTINKETSKRVCDSLNNAKEPGVFFDETTIADTLRDGCCTAMTLDALNVYLNERQTYPPRTVIAKIGQRYRKTSEDFKNIQGAFNTITKKEEEVVPDFKRSKIQAMLNLYNRKIVFASNEVDINHAPNEIKLIVQGLPLGVFIIREIFPQDNHKGEKHGHTLLFVKDASGSFFYDPNFGWSEFPQGGESEFILKSLFDCHWFWHTPCVRFYQVQ